jgi:hypothetical protein
LVQGKKSWGEKGCDRRHIIVIIIIIIMSNIPGNHEVKELEKTAILDTAHILRKVLTQRWIQRRN